MSVYTSLCCNMHMGGLVSYELGGKESINLPLDVGSVAATNTVFTSKHICS
jgi:hypothetical protein